MNVGRPLLPHENQPASFSEILRRVERRLVVDDDVEYATVGVRWYGNGAFVRERLLGAGIARKQQWTIRTGDVVYNKLFAWKGAFAIATDAVDGHLVSDKFPTYAVDQSIVDPRFLVYYFRTADIAMQAARLSKGAAAISKLTLNPPQFWDLTIPLPDLDEQRRLVAVLSDAEMRIAQAGRLRAEATAEADALVKSAIGRVMGEFEGTGRIGDVLTAKPRNGWSARCDNVDGGTPVLSLGAVTGFTYRPSEFKRTSEPTVPGAHYWLRSGDLLMTRSNTERLIGHAAIYTGDPAPCIYPDLMMRVPVDDARADTRFVYYWLRTPAIRAIIEGAGSGTSSTMKKITQGDVMGLPFPTDVGVAEQRRVVRRLDEIVQAVDALSATQRGTIDDINALFPSLLDRAFHGKLAVSPLQPLSAG
jgi:type I restriction enzyme, S subunit